MGGFGSGRHGGEPTAEACDSYVVSITSLKPFLAKPGCLTRPADFDKFPMFLRLDTSDPSRGFLEVSHASRDPLDGERKITDRVQLVSTVPTYGGRRWYFLCPRTGRRVAKLLLPRGGRHFLSRDAYGLAYACQREGRFETLQRRAATLNLRLGGQGWHTWDQEPAKPKGMHQTTYDRLVDEWRLAVDAVNEELADRLLRLAGTGSKKRRSTARA